jgi:hypothetical protein
VTGNPSVEERQMALDAVIQMQQQGMDLATELRPDLDGSIGMIVAANDYAGMLRVETAIRNGTMSRDDWQVRVGSFARMEMAARLVAMTQDMSWHEGWYVREIFANLCEIWRGADPSDTDPRFEDLFKRAKAHTTRIVPMWDVVQLPVPTEIGERITVYRGEPQLLVDATKTGVGGLSWTTDQPTAVKFATGASMRQPVTRGTVLRGKVRYEDVIAYITGRGEFELIVSPENVYLDGQAIVTQGAKPPLNWFDGIPPFWSALVPLDERTHA